MSAGFVTSPFIYWSSGFVTSPFIYWSGGFVTSPFIYWSSGSVTLPYLSVVIFLCYLCLFLLLFRKYSNFSFCFNFFVNLRYAFLL